VRSGTIDIGICHGTPMAPAAELSINRLSLLNDRMNRALISAQHPLAGRPLLELRDLVDLPFLFFDHAFQPALHEQVFAAFKAREFDPLVCGTYDGLQTVWALAAQGRGWAIGFDSQRDEPPTGTVAIPLDDFSLPFGVQALWRAGDERASVQRVLDALSEIASRSTSRSNAMAAILLVEDNVELRRVLERGLQQAGHLVTAPADSITAAQLIESSAFDLVITDIVMPEIEGLDLIRRIRSAQPDFKVIAMSGGGMGSASQYLEMAKRFGADETLHKPFRIQELIAAVDRALAS
jgi:CheY-like chemotaxis protein